MEITFNTFVTCDTRRLRFKRSFSDGNLEALDSDEISAGSTEKADDSFKEQIFGKYFPLFPQKPVFHADSLKSVSTADRQAMSQTSESEHGPPSSWGYSGCNGEETPGSESSPREILDLAAELILQGFPGHIDPETDAEREQAMLEALNPCPAEDSTEESRWSRFKKERKKYEPVCIKEMAAENQVDDEGKTTVMIRNIPCRYSQTELVDEIRRFDMPFDFLYLPPARHSAGNLGYAFINFVEPTDASAFIEYFAGHTWFYQPKSKKRGIPNFATLQGFYPNIEYYSKMKISKSKNRPYVNKEIHPDFELVYSPILRRMAQDSSETGDAESDDSPR